MNSIKHSTIYVIILGVIFLVLLLVLLAHAADYRVTLLDRTFRLHVPSVECQAYYLIIALHGGGDREDLSAADMKVYAALESDRDCVIVAYPRSTQIPGFGYQWNFAPGLGSYIQDMSFVQQVRYEIENPYYSNLPHRYSIIRSALTGFSGGAILALRMACNGLASSFDYVWSVEGDLTQSIAHECIHAPNIPRMWILNGTNDPAVPYFGGYWGYGETGLSIPDVFDLFSSLKGITAHYDYWVYDDATTHVINSGLLHHYFSEDTTTLHLLTFHGHCINGSYKQGSCFPEHGGGHRWHGTSASDNGSGVGKNHFGWGTDGIGYSIRYHLIHND